MRKLLVLLLLVLAACRPLPMYTAIEVPKRQVQELRGDPELRGLVQDVAREGVKSAVGALDAETTAEVRALFLQLTRELVAELKTAMAQALVGLEPRARHMTAALVGDLSERLPEALGPAMRGVLVDQLLAQPELKRALADTGRDLGKQAVLGANDAMLELAREKERGATAPLGTAGQLLSTRGWLVVTGIVFVGALATLVMLLRQRRRMRLAEREAERRRAIASALVSSVDVERATPDVRKVIQDLGEALAGDDVPARPRRRRPTLRHA